MVPFPPVSPPKLCTRLIPPPYTFTCPPKTLHSSRFYNRNILDDEYRPLSDSLCSFRHSPITATLLGPNILLNTLFSHTLSLRSSVNTVVYTFQKILCYYETQRQKHMDRFTKCKAITLCGDWPRRYYGQRALKGQIFIVGYCSLRTESTRTQRCFQLRTELQMWQGNCTASLIIKANEMH